MSLKDHYKTLGVAKTAAPADIKKAFRKLARHHHPDLSHSPHANQKMVELNEANDVLSDPDKRQAYDESLSEAAAPHHNGHDSRSSQWDRSSGFPDDNADFFDQIFGRTARAQRSRPERGSDQHAKIELDITDAYAGVDRGIVLHVERHDEAGHLVSEARHLQVKVPKGVHEGQHIRLAGRGSPGHAGGLHGDLLLEVVFKVDARWHAKGRDVYQRVDLAPWEAALGATVRIQTPSGEAEVTIPAGSKPGRTLRLKGRGIPGTTAGNLYLDLDVAWPLAHDLATRAAYAALAQAFPDFNARDTSP